MANPFFHFKQFSVYHDRCAMKVTTDACLFGAWCAAELTKDSKKVHRILDIGAGTGLLSLMLAQKIGAAIDAVELDTDAAEQASENFAASPWSHRLQVMQGNILTTPLAHTYDCIISNPPFYEKELQSVDALRNLAHHSQQLKLDDLLTFIQQNLTEDGSFYLLLPYKRKEEASQLITKNGLHVASEVHVHQSEKHVPFRWMIKGTKKEVQQPTFTEIKITSSNNQYTEPFITLLKDYYLYL
jgi:tRNA1Val (adenine37-N6)-methyltransferase